MFDEMAWWNEIKNRLSVALCEYSDRSLLNFQVKIRYGNPTNSNVVVIIVTIWHTVLEDLIMMSWWRNLASLADPEISLPPPLQPITGQINPPYTSSLYFFKNDFNIALTSTTRSFGGFLYFWVSNQFLFTLLISLECATCHALLLLLLLSFRRYYSG
jgi:hypothetical protein